MERQLLNFFSGIILMMLYACGGQPAQKEEAEAIESKAEAFVDLFNGKSLEGWKVIGVKEARFYVEDGMLVAETTMGIPNTFLATEKEYSDFELEATVKVPQGINTGIQYRSAVYPIDTATVYVTGKLDTVTRNWEAGRVHGYQFELDPSERAWSGGFYEEGGRGWIEHLADQDEKRAAFKNGDWNKLKVVVRGDSLQTWLNDVPIINTTDGGAESGFIAIQLHSINKEEDAGKKILFKDIRLKELH
ncbi:DUF1080 domain-containing protein [Flammeovirgaceae bacterium SG7u.111]|nr:DUF1080 domain-containing protein [Flammeovirgaceae bacterium SG7u.132]WPO35894.1 DUF1080 domain-containing protein [Flammeovirgaceae bacterium SG7u.111]